MVLHTIRALALCGLLAASAQAQTTTGPSTAPSAPVTSTVRHADISLRTGVVLHVAEAGDPEGRPVLFLHGTSDSWYSFSRVFERLPAGVRAIALTHRGHGDSERPSCCYAMEDLAEDAVAVLDALGIDRAAVVGHSMSSFVARAIAIAHPERVERLVLIGTGPTPRVAAFDELLPFVRTFEEPVDTAFIREFQESTIAEPVPPEFLETVIGESRKLPARVWRDAFEGMGAYDDADGVGGLTMPVLIVSGELDAIWGPGEHDDLARLIPGATLLRYEATGHASHWERPDRFVADLARFLGR